MTLFLPRVGADRDLALTIRGLRTAMKHLSQLRVSLSGKRDSEAYRLQRSLGLYLAKLERAHRGPVEVGT